MRGGIARSLIPAGALAGWALVCAQEAKASPQWLPECVGRLEMRLPGPSEQAAWDANEVAKDIRGDLRIEPAARYLDGERAFSEPRSRAVPDYASAWRRSADDDARRRHDSRSEGRGVIRASSSRGWNH